MSNLTDFAQQLGQLQAKQQYRQLPEFEQAGKYVVKNAKSMLNLASNDYLGLAEDQNLQQEFLKKFSKKIPHFGSSSSRLLTGNFPIANQLEQQIAQAFQRPACLLFNSGYHANIGILPAIANKQTLILADKLVHASLIDGIRLSAVPFFRYRHNDYAHLHQLLEKHHRQYERIIVVTESLFSMDGDVADLAQLVALKRKYPKTMLYVDEAHAIGVYGERGLGMAEVFDCIQDIDFLVGTFGKALASMGAYVVCDQIIKDYLLNFMRPLIFSTALPPFNLHWTAFVFQQLPHLQQQRQHLAQLSRKLRQHLAQEQLSSSVQNETCIIPYILGENQATLETAQRLQQQGFYCLPIRPPTVPVGSARIRLSLSANMSMEELDQFLEAL